MSTNIDHFYYCFQAILSEIKLTRRVFLHPFSLNYFNILAASRDSLETSVIFDNSHKAQTKS